VVQPGQEIAYLHHRADELPMPPPPVVLHEDDRLLAVHKPDTVPVSPSGVYYFTALVMALREQHGLPELTPMHRLDLETSGPIVFAKRRSEVAALHALFAAGAIHKRYRALAWGHVSVTQREIAGRIVPDGSSPIQTRLRLVPAQHGAPVSLTRVHAITHQHHPRHGPLSELLLEPVTGKTNQLRVHLAAIGHPIVGDKKYHGDPAVFLDWYAHRDFARLRDRLLLPRQALMCESLGFPHPFTGEPVRIAAPADAWTDKLRGLHERAMPPT
jgi:23S rRNA-/tRNA-specific pseudouridylate synthase